MYIVTRKGISTKICGVFSTLQRATQCIQRNISYFDNEHYNSLKLCISHYQSLLQTSVTELERENILKQITQDTHWIEMIEQGNFIPSKVYNLEAEFEIVQCELDCDYVESESRILKSMQIKQEENKNVITIPEEDLKMIYSPLANTMLPSTTGSRKRKLPPFES